MQFSPSPPNHHHHCSHGVFIPLCCYSPSTCTCTSFVQCQWLPLTLTTPKYFCVVVTLPRIFHILQECISCNKNFSWYWTVFPLTSKSPTLLLCCSFHIQLLFQTVCNRVTRRGRILKMEISSEFFCLPACSEYKALRQNMKLKKHIFEIRVSRCRHLKPNRQSYSNYFNVIERYDKIWLP